MSRLHRGTLAKPAASPNLELGQAVLGLLQTGFRLGEEVFDELAGRAGFVPDVGSTLSLQYRHVGVGQVRGDQWMVGDGTDLHLPRRQGYETHPGTHELLDNALFLAVDDRLTPDKPPDQILSCEEIVAVHGALEQFVYGVRGERIDHRFSERAATQDCVLK